MAASSVPTSAVYVAGMFGERDKVHALQRELVDRGHSITHDWTTQESITSDPEEKRRFADNDIRGVSDSDWVVVLMDHPTYPYRGTFTEIGCALGLKKPVYIISPKEPACACRTNVFFFATGILHFESVEEFLHYLDDQSSSSSSS